MKFLNAAISDKVSPFNNKLVLLIVGFVSTTGIAFAIYFAIKLGKNGSVEDNPTTKEVHIVLQSQTKVGGKYEEDTDSKACDYSGAGQMVKDGILSRKDLDERPPNVLNNVTSAPGIKRSAAVSSASDQVSPKPKPVAKVAKNKRLLGVPIKSDTHSAHETPTPVVHINIDPPFVETKASSEPSQDYPPVVKVEALVEPPVVPSVVTIEAPDELFEELPIAITEAPVEVYEEPSKIEAPAEPSEEPLVVIAEPQVDYWEEPVVRIEAPDEPSEESPIVITEAQVEVFEEPPVFESEDSDKPSEDGLTSVEIEAQVEPCEEVPVVKIEVPVEPSEEPSLVITYAQVEAFEEPPVFETESVSEPLEEPPIVITEESGEPHVLKLEAPAELTEEPPITIAQALVEAYEEPPVVETESLSEFSEEPSNVLTESPVEQFEGSLVVKVEAPAEFVEEPTIVITESLVEIYEKPPVFETESLGEHSEEPHIFITESQAEPCEESPVVKVEAHDENLEEPLTVMTEFQVEAYEEPPVFETEASDDPSDSLNVPEPQKEIETSKGNLENEEEEADKDSKINGALVKEKPIFDGKIIEAVSDNAEVVKKLLQVSVDAKTVLIEIRIDLEADTNFFEIDAEPQNEKAADIVSKVPNEIHNNVQPNGETPSGKASGGKDEKNNVVMKNEEDMTIVSNSISDAKGKDAKIKDALKASAEQSLVADIEPTELLSTSTSEGNNIVAQVGKSDDSFWINGIFKWSGFEFIDHISEGTNSSIYWVCYESKWYFAMKVSKDGELLKDEINLLNSFQSPFFLKPLWYSKISKEVAEATFADAKNDLYVLLYDLLKINLQWKFDKKALITEDQKLSYLAQTISALHYLHSQGIVHADLTPENIFIEANDEIFISGLGRPIRYDPKNPQTQFGTPWYTAPEVYRGEANTPASDIFSLGMIFLQMITIGDVDTEIFRKKVTEFGQCITGGNLLCNTLKNLKPSDNSKLTPEMDLLIGMTHCDLAMRLSIPEIMRHPYFDCIDWGIELPPITRYEPPVFYPDISAKKQIFLESQVESFEPPNYNASAKDLKDDGTSILLKSARVELKATSDKKDFMRNRFLLHYFYEYFKDQHLSNPFGKPLWSGELSEEMAEELVGRRDLKYVLAVEIKPQTQTLHEFLEPRPYENGDNLFRTYIARLVQMLRFLHHFGVIVGNLNFDDVRVSENGELMLTSLDGATYNSYKYTPKRTLFSAPEMYSARACIYESDLFSLGVIMLHYLLPKNAEFEIYEYDHARNNNRELEFKQTMVDFESKCRPCAPFGAIELFENLVQPDPRKRLSLENIMCSDFFIGIDLYSLEYPLKRIQAPSFNIVDVSAKTEQLPKRYKLGPGENIEYSLNDFQFLEEFGTGGFSRVFRGILVKTQQPVAIKVYKNIYEDIEGQFHRDVLYLHNLRDAPFVCQLIYWTTLSEQEALDIFEDASFRFVMVMEYAKNGDLFDRLTTAMWPEIRKWMSQLVVALQHIHARGIIHRDLKLENIILNELDDVRVIDFGLSKRFKTSHEKLESTQCGTPGFVAPEVLAYNQASYASDVFSLGIMFYYFIAPNTDVLVNMCEEVEVTKRMGSGELRKLAMNRHTLEVADRLPKGAETLFRGMVHPEPDKRLTIEGIMKSEYFEGVDWRGLGALEAPSAFA